MVVMALALMVLIADGLLTGIGVIHIIETLKAGNAIDFTFLSWFSATSSCVKGKEGVWGECDEKGRDSDQN